MKKLYGIWGEKHRMYSIRSWKSESEKYTPFITIHLNKEMLGDFKWRWTSNE
jgi:hypothetical protein